MHLNTKALQSLPLKEQELFAKFGCSDELDPPFACVHHAFEFYAASQPDATAAEHLEESISYKELNFQSNSLAHELRKEGIRPGSRVCLLVQRSIPMVVGILAILKAAGQYVPLDGGIVTQSTLDFILDDSGSTVVLCMREFAHRVQLREKRSVMILENIIEHTKTSECRLIKPPDLSSPDDGVYVIYTSGEKKML